MENTKYDILVKNVKKIEKEMCKKTGTKVEMDILAIGNEKYITKVTLVSNSFNFKELCKSVEQQCIEISK